MSCVILFLVAKTAWTWNLGCMTLSPMLHKLWRKCAFSGLHSSNTFFCLLTSIQFSASITFLQVAKSLFAVDNSQEVLAECTESHNK